MKNGKKILVAGLACLVVLGIAVPTAAFSLQNQETPLKKEQVEQKTEVRQSGAEDMLKQAVQTVSTKGAKVTDPEDVILPVVTPTEEPEDNSEVPPAENNSDEAQDTEAPAEDNTDTEAPVEDNTDTEAPADVTENTDPGTTAAVCPYYVDANGDGYCDHCAHNGACGNNFTDVNGDGICDYCTHNGSGHCGNYSDTNGDGYCDNWNGYGNGNGGGGHHGGGHHGGRHW